MKIKNFAMLAGIAGLLSACGGSSIVEPADLNEQRVFFAFNSSEISDESRDNLLGQALYMKNHEDVKIQIGIDPARISTISYGKERPLVQGTGEEVWKYNRNATTTVK